MCRHCPTTELRISNSVDNLATHRIQAPTAILITILRPRNSADQITARRKTAKGATKRNRTGHRIYGAPVSREKLVVEVVEVVDRVWSWECVSACASLAAGGNVRVRVCVSDCACARAKGKSARSHAGKRDVPNKISPTESGVGQRRTSLTHLLHPRSQKWC